MSKENIVVPGQFYCGYAMREEQNTYDLKEGKHTKGEVTRLGFATYFEDNAAFRKRKSTIDSWSHKTETPDTFDNAPVSGFKLSKKVTHGGGWNDLNVFWRIVDPRGFELEIQSGNLGKLFQYCTIDHGTVNEECVYGWDKANQSKLVLLPVNSDIYLSSIVSTERHNAKSLSLKDLKIGDWVHLKNNMSGKYFGKVTYGHVVEYGRNTGKVEFATSYIIDLDDTEESPTGGLYFVQTPKVIDAKDGEKIYTKEEAEEYLNKRLWTKIKLGGNPHSIMIHVAGNTHGPQNTRMFTYDDPKVCTAKFVSEKYTISSLAEYFRDKYKLNMHSAFSSLTYGHRPLIVHKGGRKFVVMGPADTDHRYSGDKQAQSDVYTFLTRKQDNVKLSCVEVLEAYDAAKGLQLHVNPRYNETNRYGYGRQEEYIETDINLVDCDHAEMLDLEFKDVLVKFVRRD